MAQFAFYPGESIGQGAVVDIEPSLPGLDQEVGGIGGEPHLTLILMGPEGKGAEAGLHRFDPQDGVVDPFPDRCRPSLCSGFEGIQVEQGKGPAGGLLKTAEGVAVEFVEEPLNVQSRCSGDLAGDRYRPGEEAADQLGVDGYRHPRQQLEHPAPVLAQAGLLDRQSPVVAADRSAGIGYL